MNELEVALRLISRDDYIPSDFEMLSLGYDQEDLDRFHKFGYFPSNSELKFIAERVVMKYFALCME